MRSVDVETFVFLSECVCVCRVFVYDTIDTFYGKFESRPLQGSVRGERKALPPERAKLGLRRSGVGVRRGLERKNEIYR